MSPAYSTAQLRHNAEAAHRLPQLGGKCQNVHGHSWQITVSVGALALDDKGIAVEFGEFKAGLRGWIDTHLDHGIMLGAADPLTPLLSDMGKVFRFGAKAGVGDEKLAEDLPWPTVELVATLLDRVAAQVLRGCAHPHGCWVRRVHVAETAVNAATLERPQPPHLPPAVSVKGAQW